MTKTFAQRCLEVASQVPAGKVTTYKEIANCLNSRAYRAVGNAMNKNPDAPAVPCHRVVAADGSLGGYASGTEAKKALLAREGITVRDNRITDFERHLYRFPRA